MHKPFREPQEVWLVEQTDPNGGWAGRSLGQHPHYPLTSSFGEIVRITSPALTSKADGRLVLSFVIAGTTWLYMLHQADPNSSNWLEGAINLTQDEWA
jgi:hypothetical protein